MVDIVLVSILHTPLLTSSSTCRPCPGPGLPCRGPSSCRGCGRVSDLCCGSCSSSAPFLSHPEQTKQQLGLRAKGNKLNLTFQVKSRYETHLQIYLVPAPISVRAARSAATSASAAAVQFASQLAADRLQVHEVTEPGAGALARLVLHTQYLLHNKYFTA